MQTQSFFLRTGDDNVATYQLVIQALDMLEGYSIRVRAEDGSDVPCRAADSGDYIIDRSDGPGRFKATIAIVDAQGRVCDERQVEVSFSRGTDPSIVDAVAKVLEKYSSGGFAGNAFAELHTKAGGEDIAATCEHYFRSDATADWRLRCLVYLNVAANSPQLKNHSAMTMKVIHHALGLAESDAHLGLAVNIGLRANVAPPTRFVFLLRALQCSFSNTGPYQNILGVIANITPSSERPKVGAIVSELFAQYTDYGVRAQALAVISAFGYRNALPVIVEALSTTTDLNILRAIVSILQSWNATNSAPQLLDLLDITNDGHLTILVTQALKQFDYRKAIPTIEQMIPVSGVEKARALEAALKGWK